MHPTPGVVNTLLMYQKLQDTIAQLQSFENITTDRKAVLQPLIDYIQQKTDSKQPVLLHFICTHNSRRSHLAQVWAQCAAAFYNIPHLYCYSGGTEETALFPKVTEVLAQQGFTVFQISHSSNQVYGIKFSDNAPAILGFSKQFQHPFNPSTNFAAIMTCSQADQGCPFVSGAEKRIAITYEDPKISDHTDYQNQTYSNRSLEIASEMLYVFSKIQ